MFNLIVIWIMLLAAALAVLVLYYLIYTKRVNRQIQSGGRGKMRMLDFPKAVIMVTILFLCSICLANSCAPAETGVVSRNTYAIIDTSGYQYMAYSSVSDLEDASFAKAFSEHENEGYVRREVKDGDFRFVVFTSVTPPDPFHPDFLCYVTYTGSDAADMSAMSSNARFFPVNEEEKNTGNSMMMGNVTQSMLVMGNYDNDYQVALTFGLYDRAGEKRYYDSTDDPETEMESFARSTGTVLIKQE